MRNHLTNYKNGLFCDAMSPHAKFEKKLMSLLETCKEGQTNRAADGWTRVTTKDPVG